MITDAFPFCLGWQLTRPLLCTRSFVLDFKNTQAIDSTALGAIVQVFKTLRSRDGSLHFCEVGTGVKRVFAITRVDRVFPIHDTLDQAYKASAAGAA